jgi:hypothetical protein
MANVAAVLGDVSSFLVVYTNGEVVEGQRVMRDGSTAIAWRKLGKVGEGAVAYEAVPREATVERVTVTLPGEGEVEVVDLQMLQALVGLGSYRAAWELSAGALHHARVPVLGGQILLRKSAVLTYLAETGRLKGSLRTA